MPYLFVRHRVRDFGRWKAIFDGHAAARQALGCLGGQLFRNSEDPSDVSVLLQWRSLEGARAFTAPADLGRIQEDAGVLGEVTCLFLGDPEPVSV